MPARRRLITALAVAATAALPAVGHLDEHDADKERMRADTDLLVEDNARAAEALARRFVEIARSHGHA